MDTILETEKLSKRFGGFEAVSDLNLRVRKGSICAFLGQNGAGKTTTLRMLLGMMRPSQPRGSPKTGHVRSAENRPERPGTLTLTEALIGSVGMSNVLSEEKKQQVIALACLSQ